MSAFWCSLPRRVAPLVLLVGFIPLQAVGAADAGVTISPYPQASFSPSRGKVFTLPLRLADPAGVKALAVEIRTSDDDLVRRLDVEGLTGDRHDYEVAWDGRDADGQIVPDEAYVPVPVVTDVQGQQHRIDMRGASGGEEVYEFEKAIRNGVIEYTLPVASRVLIRSGIKNGPMLRAVVDWEPRTAGFHAERWNGRDSEGVVAIEQHPQVGYLIIGYTLPDHSILTHGNDALSYREYRERKKWPLKQADAAPRPLERGGAVLRPESFLPVLQQKSPRIEVRLLGKDRREPVSSVAGFEEMITEVRLNAIDELYLDQDRYEISFFVDNQFIAEEEQGFVPFNWRWAPGRLGIEPGEHVLTVNVSSYEGQVGVKNIAFTLEPQKDP